MGNSDEKIETESFWFRVFDIEGDWSEPQGCSVNPFSSELNEWNHELPENAKLMLDFLNGKQIVCHKNRLIANVRDSEPLDDATVMERWITGNPKFSIKMKPDSLGAEISVVPGSIRLVERKPCRDMEHGAYHELTIEFDTTFRCTQPVCDLSDSELDSPLLIEPNSMHRPNTLWVRVIKYILQNPNSLYIGGSDSFVQRLPQSSEAAVRLFAKVFENDKLLDFTSLYVYCMDFTHDMAQRKALQDGQKSFRFNGVDEKWASVGYVGNTEQEKACKVKILLPPTKQQPALFVRDVRKGLACCDDYICLCESHGCLENFSVNFGDFELTVDNLGNKPQRSDAELVEKLCGYLRTMRNFLSSVADFLDLLLKGTNDADVARRSMVEFITQMIQLEPQNYMEYFITGVQEFANYCITGEWVHKIMEYDPDLDPSNEWGAPL